MCTKDSVCWTMDDEYAYGCGYGGNNENELWCVNEKEVHGLFLFNVDPDYFPYNRCEDIQYLVRTACR